MHQNILADNAAAMVDIRMNKKGMTEQPTTSAIKKDGGRYFLFDATKKKIKPGPKRTAPQNIIKRAGGLSSATLKYSDYIPLYELWCGYFGELLSSMKQPDERLLKTDYHGCILFVTDSPNPSQIGLYGIVLHESKSTFQLLTKKDKLVGMYNIKWDTVAC
uniref:Ribonuclease P protein subunit p29 n=1 Tax=Panagrolaimus sp. ES5 TaxID=591445 RepID=A0AC34G790_9BILA